MKNREMIFPEEAVDRVCKIIADLCVTILVLYVYILTDDIFFILISFMFISFSIFNLIKIINIAK